MTSSHTSKPFLLIQADSLNSKYGGIYEYTKNLTQNFESLNFKAITKTHSAEIETEKQIVIPRKKIKFYGTYRNAYLIPKVVNETSATHYWQTDHLLPLNLPKHLKKILTIHDLSSYFFPQFHTLQNYLGHKLFLKKSLKQADLILTPSQSIKNELLNNFNLSTNIQTIFNGCNQNPQIIPPLKKINDPFFLYVGTIEPRKNLETLINAYQNIQSQIPEKLLLIGNQGWKSDKIHKIIKQNPNIVYLGQLSEPKKNFYIKSATALVYPSLYEGFGLPPLEAMNIGTPVITSNIPVFQEIYQNHSLQFETKNSPELSQKLLELSQNQSLRIKLIQQGKSLAQKLSWQKTAQKIEKLISEL